MSYEGSSSQMLKKEFEALSKLQHKNIVRLNGAFPKPSEMQMLVVMEFLAGGELYDYWKRFEGRRMPEDEVAEIMLQITDAIEYCHNKGVIHRDLKFQNVLLVDPIDEIPTHQNAPSKIKVKVADFGIFGSNAGGEAEKVNAGSLKYMAPEILRGRTESDPKIDVWSLGVMMYSMIMGNYPFSSNNRDELRKQVCTQEIKFKIKGRVEEPKPEKVIAAAPLATQKTQRISILKN